MFDPEYSNSEIKSILAKDANYIITNTKSISNKVVDLACLNPTISNNAAEKGFKVTNVERVLKTYIKQKDSDIFHPDVELVYDTIQHYLAEPKQPRVQRRFKLMNLDLCSQWSNAIIQILSYSFSDHIMLTLSLRRETNGFRDEILKYALSDSILDKYEAKVQIHKDTFDRHNYSIEFCLPYQGGGNTPMIYYVLKNKNY